MWPTESNFINAFFRTHFHMHHDGFPVLAFVIWDEHVRNSFRLNRDAGDRQCAIGQVFSGTLNSPPYTLYCAAELVSMASLNALIIQIPLPRSFGD